MYQTLELIEEQIKTAVLASKEANFDETGIPPQIIDLRQRVDLDLCTNYFDVRLLEQ